MRAITVVKVPNLVGILVAVFCSSAKGLAIYTDKDGNFSPQTLSVPYAFYNDDHGYARGQV